MAFAIYFVLSGAFLWAFKFPVFNYLVGSQLGQLKISSIHIELFLVLAPLLWSLVTTLFAVVCLKIRNNIISVEKESKFIWVFPLVRTQLQKEKISLNQVGITPSKRLFAGTLGIGPYSIMVFSTRLVSRLSEKQLLSVIAHEISHIRHYDFAKIKILEGILNTASLALGLSLLINGNISTFFSGCVFVSLYVLNLLIARKVSRTCEFRADFEAASNVGPDDMIDMLKILSSEYGGLSKSSVFANHPSYENRIRALICSKLSATKDKSMAPEKLAA